MRKHLSGIAALFVLVLVGCEAAPYPLSAPGDVPVRSELLGNWQTTGEDGEELALTVMAFSEFEYLAFVITPDEDMPSFFRMYESDLEGLRFANIQCVGCEEEEAEFVFSRLTLVENALHMRWVSDDFYESVENAESSDDVVLAFLEAVETGDALFSEEWEWSRVDK